MRPIVAVIAAVSVLALVLAGCSKQPGEPTMPTGEVVTAAEVTSLFPLAIVGSPEYARVSSAWVEWYYGEFRAGLSAGAYGIVAWDGSFKCTAFTTKFVGDAQMRYFSQTFHSSISAKTAGLGEYWYTPDGSATGHAVVVALTEDPAKRYFEPQTGRWVVLSASETGVRQMRLRKFN